MYQRINENHKLKEKKIPIVVYVAFNIHEITLAQPNHLRILSLIYKHLKMIQYYNVLLSIVSRKVVILKLKIIILVGIFCKLITAIFCA